MKQLLFFFSMLCVIQNCMAQMADGSNAPNFDVTDLDGNDHELYDYLDDGIHMILDFGTTWCHPCWSYHNTGILDDLYQDYGPDGTNEIMVLFMEGDGDTNDNCCYGPSGCNDGTWGNWTTHDYPVVNLTGSDLSVVNAYQIGYWPTLYIINGEHNTVWEVGPTSYNNWESIIFESFSLQTEIILTPGCEMGTIEADADGGIGNLSYEWSNGDNGSTITVEPGFYDLTITDAIGYFIEIENIHLQSNEEEIEIDEIEIEHVSCYGDDDGSIRVDVDGNDDIDYIWSNGEDDDYNNHLESGEYYLTIVNNDNGCQLELEFEIEEPDELEIDLEAISTTCGLDNGSIIIEATGGEGDLFFEYDNEETDEDLIEDLEAGQYTVYVYDENGCSESDNIQIGSSQALSAGLLGLDVINCLQEELLISLEPNTANDLEYEWRNDSGQLISDDNYVMINEAGIYHVLIVDEEDLCEFETSFEIESDLEVPDFELDNIQDLSCELVSFEAGYITTNPDAYTATWSFIDENGDLQLIEGSSLIITAAGNYTLSLMDNSNGCTSEQNFEVIFEEELLESNFSFVQDESVLFVESLVVGENFIETWTVDGETVIPADDGSIVFTENGNYMLCLTAENDCGTSTYCEEIEISGIVSAVEALDIEGIDITAINNTIVINNHYQSLSQSRLVIYNLSGSLVADKKIELPLGMTFLALNSLNTGIYLIQLDTEVGMELMKLFLAN